MRLVIFLTVLTIATSAYAVSYPPELLFEHEEFATIVGTKLTAANGTGNHPAIPKSWKLISVSSGEEPNCNNLWFQDIDGSVYLLQGVMSQKKFIVHENVYKIPAQ